MIARYIVLKILIIRTFGWREPE